MNKESLLEKLNNNNQHKEIWVTSPNGSSICALINGDIGWLMYLRFHGDIGFSTRNPIESSDEEIEYILSNGQADSYPKKWAYPIEIIKEALVNFIESGQKPTEVKWNDDSKTNT
jgi:hypothetical protein